MVYRVRIFLWNSAKGSTYLGEQDLKVRPVVGSQANFKLSGRLHSGHVRDIAPADWDPTSALIPTVRVEWRGFEAATNSAAGEGRALP